MIYKGFVGPSYESQAFTGDNEDLVNWYVERLESPGATAKLALCPTPGIESLHITAGSQGRAHFVDGSGREFAIISDIFFELDADATATFIAFVAVDSNPATISSNGDGGGELFITSGGNGYVYNLGTGVFTTIAALNGKATMGDSIDGYFLALDASTGTFYASDLLDGLTWATGTMFAQRIDSPDPWLAMRVKGRFIHLIGEQTGSVWFNSGASPFPFAQHPSGGSLPYGIAAPFSLVVSEDSLLWLGSTKNGRGFVLRSTGFSPEVVSTYPVQYAMSRYGTVSDAYGDAYNDLGHSFYVLNFPTENVTWVYDLQMSMWHKRGAWDSDRGRFALWRPRCHAYAFGEHRWLDTSGGGVFRMSSDLVTDVAPGSDQTIAIRRLRRAPCIENENRRVRFISFEVDLEVGFGLVESEEGTPLAMMRFSNDGGKTWSNESWRSVGKRGQYGVRVQWERLGQGRRRVFELVVSDETTYRVTNAYIHLVPEIQNEEGAA